MHIACLFICFTVAHASSAGSLLPEDKLNQALQNYNAVNAAEIEKLLLGFDQAEKVVKDLADSNVTAAQRNAAIQAIKGDRKRFVEEGRLPEVANMTIARFQYHRLLYQAQQKLLGALDEELTEAKKNNSPLAPLLTQQKEELMRQLPRTEPFKPKTTWKGFRYNAVLRRSAYEFTLNTIDKSQFTGTLTNAAKAQMEVEGKLNGPHIQFRITREISGTKGNEQGFTGIILGNRILMKVVSGGTEFPVILYLQ